MDGYSIIDIEGMRFMKRKTKQIIVLVLSIIVIIGSISYALWSRTYTQEEVTEISSGCFDVSIDFDDNSIALENTYPVTNHVGSKNQPYIITIQKLFLMTFYFVVKILMK